jgi:GTP-binding protein EngB required for normal cell division
MISTFTIVPFGGPGVGKSTLCNFLIDGKNSGLFKSSDTTEGGETKHVTHQEGHALGDSSLKKRVKVFDVPGLGDPDLPIDMWVDEIKEGFEPEQMIDMAIMVMKATDMRMSVEQIIVAKAMQKFLDNLKPKATFLCFSFCDKQMPDEKFTKSKIASIKKYCGLEIPYENVVYF